MNFSKLSRPRGFTLVELMIVVAIIGILAAVAGVAFTKYTKSAKITQLKQYAMEVANGQEQYKSRNSSYLNAGEYNTSNKKKFEKLLGFKHDLAANVTVETEAGNAGSAGSCSICEGATPPDDQIWFAVRVTKDLDPDETADTMVVYHNGLEQPVVVNEFD